MKKFLALIAITLFVFVGCTAEETTPVVEEDATTPDVVVEEDVVPTADLLPEGVEFVSNEDRTKRLDEKVARELEADAQIKEDQDMLNEIAATRPLRVEDCEGVKNTEFKAECLVFAAVDEEIDE